MFCYRVDGRISRQCNVRNVCVSYPCIEEIFPLMQENNTHIDKICFIMYNIIIRQHIVIYYVHSC